MSFLKFAILATLGESIALRITTGSYYRQGFGFLPKCIAWGVLGMLCKLAFGIFSTSTPTVMMGMGIDLTEGGLLSAILKAFFTSVTNNLIFAPVLMLSHKLIDLHIENNRGSLTAFITKPHMPDLFRQVNWDTMWGFVFAKTIPLFWIPAHTITFLLPVHFQILFAAILSVALGTLLTFATLKSTTL